MWICNNCEYEFEEQYIYNKRNGNTGCPECLNENIEEMKLQGEAA